MKSMRRSFLKAVLRIASLLMGRVSAPASSSFEEIYKFERMWPNIQQPWYFNFPVGIAVDRTGNVYFAEMYGHCIRKFTSNGQFVTKWGEEGSNDGELRSPAGLALRGNESIYVADVGNSQIQKFGPVR